MVIAITPSPLHPIQREIEKTVETVEGIIGRPAVGRNLLPTGNGPLYEKCPKTLLVVR